MRTKLRLHQLIQLVLALGIETRDVTASLANATKEGMVLQQNESENNTNTTDNHAPLPEMRSLNSADDGYTAGRSLCRTGSECDFHQGSTYKYCYVDYSDNWDYCCTGTCDYHGEQYMWCQSGDQWQYCGNAGFTDINGRSCHYAYPCGMHQEKGAKAYYWCYVDHKLNWERCCAPSSPCDYNGESYKWCYTGYKKETDWQYCK